MQIPPGADGQSKAEAELLSCSFERGVPGKAKGKSNATQCKSSNWSPSQLNRCSPILLQHSVAAKTSS